MMKILQRVPLPAPPPIRLDSGTPPPPPPQNPPAPQKTTEAGTPETDTKSVLMRPQLWLGISVAILLAYVIYTGRRA